MKCFDKRLLMIGLLLIYGLVIMNGFSQKILSEEQQIEQWKKWVKKYPPSNSSREIELLNFFPKDIMLEKDVYLWKSTDIEADSEGNIYVLDNKMKSIFKFDSDGVFIKKAGGPGQGPGEFQNPISICITKTRLVVSDTMKYELSIWDLELNYIKAFKVFKAYYDIAASESGNIYGVPLRINNETDLIDVLNDEGQKIASFGRPMAGTDKDWQIPNMLNIDVNETNEVFTAFIFFPMVCKYDQNGKLRNVYKIENKAMRETEVANFKSMNTNSRLYWQIIRAIRANNQGFAILHNVPFTQVLEFDVSGNVKENYWVIRSYDYKAEDFILSRRSGMVEISLLIGSPKNVIEVFRPKNK